MNTPLIGLGLRIPAESGHNLSSNYPNAVTRAGGMPIAIPVCCREFVEQYADMLDGLILLFMAKRPSPKRRSLTGRWIRLSLIFFTPC